MLLTEQSYHHVPENRKEAKKMYMPALGLLNNFNSLLNRFFKLHLGLMLLMGVALMLM